MKIKMPSSIDKTRGLLWICLCDVKDQCGMYTFTGSTETIEHKIIYRNLIYDDFIESINNFFVGKYILYKNKKFEGYLLIVGFNRVNYNLIVQFGTMTFEMSYSSSSRLADSENG